MYVWVSTFVGAIGGAKARARSTVVVLIGIPTPPGYAGLLSVGSEPSVVYRITAPVVAEVIFAENGSVKRPRFGLNCVSATNPAKTLPFA